MDVLHQLVQQLQLTDGSSYVIKKGVTYYLNFESSTNGGRVFNRIILVLDSSAWLPVPLMALTLFIFVASQIVKLPAYGDQVIKAIPFYLVFMIIMPII